jgi:hypothetical protein
VFWTLPRKLKPVRKVTLSTPLRCARNSSTRFTASRVRLKDASGGVCTSAVMKPWSSTGRKPAGRRMKAQPSAITIAR